MKSFASIESDCASFNWFAKVDSLKGIGPKLATYLSKLNIFVIGDLLLHCPFRYENRTVLTPITEIKSEEWVVVQGEITDIYLEKRLKKRAIVTLKENGKSLEVTFFHQYLRLKVGDVLRCFGQIKLSTKGLQLFHPEHEIILPGQKSALPKRLTPVYPLVAGISQRFLQKTINDLLKKLKYPQELDELFLKIFPTNTLSFMEALKIIHQPLPSEDKEALCKRTHDAYSRLIIEEFCAYHLSVKKMRHVMRYQKASPLKLSSKVASSFIKNLAFTLTYAQQRVWQEIQADLLKSTPMFRLVQGDVGCGKTIIAALSAFAAITCGKQVALMVPTEILAEQHFLQFKKWFEALGYRCCLLTGKLPNSQRRNLEENITLGLANVVIGTHALFQENIQFKALGLIIIDEEHRFGVNQRAALQFKGIYGREYPHQLMMTATPIPRTLAMSQYAHFDISTIDEYPKGRQPIQTIILSQNKRASLIERIRTICERKEQIYWVCTLIMPSQEQQAAEEMVQILQKELPYSIGLVHGKMPAEEKNAVMQAFYTNKISILVATTVIEVGVNVPNATLMIIENPERLGLAQLHQLRGRIGRGNKASYCTLLYQPPLNEIAYQRLNILRDIQDGFVIAEADLQLRGPGEILGTNQTGEIPFKIVDLSRDSLLIQELLANEQQWPDFPEKWVDILNMRWQTKFNDLRLKSCS